MSLQYTSMIQKRQLKVESGRVTKCLFLQLLHLSVGDTSVCCCAWTRYKQQQSELPSGSHTHTDGGSCSVEHTHAAEKQMKHTSEVRERRWGSQFKTDSLWWRDARSRWHLSVWVGHAVTVTQEHQTGGTLKSSQCCSLHRTDDLIRFWSDSLH